LAARRCDPYLGEGSVDAYEIRQGHQVSSVALAFAILPPIHHITGAACVSLRFYSPGVELGFAVTPEKAQGQTLERVILDLNCTRLSVASLYVAASRVRSSEHVRALPFSVEQRLKLEQLRFAAPFEAWWRRTTVVHTGLIRQVRVLCVMMRTCRLVA